MIFNVISANEQPAATPNTCYLRRNITWNDWFKYHTVFELIVVDSVGKIHVAGNVKIAKTGMDTNHQRVEKEGLRQTPLPERFESLDESYFSLGQSENYYETLSAIDSHTRVRVLESLRDIAYNVSLIEAFRHLDVYSDSVCREINETIVTSRYSDLAGGRVTLTPFAFRFNNQGDNVYSAYSMEFVVTPNSMPPSNLHAIIGRNGVGKTHCLRSMLTCILAKDLINAKFINMYNEEEFPFRRIVSVSFSAFDSFSPIPDNDKHKSRIEFEYIGLKSLSDEGGLPHLAIDSDAMFNSFIESANRCRQGVRRERWQRALESLKTDPMFSENGIANISLPENEPSQFNHWFDRLSSGHKLILLTITKLVAATEERTLVMIDEPEAHLHPPLLSAFVRCLSQLLVDRNAVAIIATHSPVVLQELPSSCTHIMSRTGGNISAYRPELETFGESIGRLTSEVFQHEVIQSGFNNLIAGLASKFTSYEEAVSSFDGKLGSVARSILRMHFLRKA